MCVAAPAYVGTDLPHQREQLRWFGGMVGNHVADLVARYGTDGPVPRALTDYIKGREGYDYAHHGRPTTRTWTSCRTRSWTGSACSARPPRTWTGCASWPRPGVDQFALYLMHDQEEETLAAYGEEIIPALR